MLRFEVHSHTHYSNIRLLDCINRPKDLVNRAIELGLKGIAITDHETLSSHMELNIYQKEMSMSFIKTINKTIYSNLSKQKTKSHSLVDDNEMEM